MKANGTNCKGISAFEHVDATQTTQRDDDAAAQQREAGNRQRRRQKTRAALRRSRLRLKQRACWRLNTRTHAQEGSEEKEKKN